MLLDRRGAIRAGLAAVAALAAPAVLGQARPRVVVVGGGAGGASFARALAMGGGGGVDVTLIEPSKEYYTCFFGNLYIGGFVEFASLGHSYAGLAVNHAINVVHDWALAIDRDPRQVVLAGGGRVPYDRLVLSPGIDFIEGAIPGWDIAAEARMPHAYKGGTQVALLKAQVAAMPQGGVFALVAPPNPYRCPPGPYERVSMIAHHLRATNPTAKILIFEPKEAFAKQQLFEAGWSDHYPGMIEVLPDAFTGGVERVDAAAMEIVAGGEVTRVDAACVIGPQRAGRIVQVAGLTDATGWAPIDPFTMRARADPFVTVLGDSAQPGDMPKSAFAANSQAKVAAMAILVDLLEAPGFAPRYANVCWSLIDTDDCVRIGAAFAPTPEKIATVDGSAFLSAVGEDAETRRTNYLASLAWYAAITNDMFA